MSDLDAKRIATMMAAHDGSHQKCLDCLLCRTLADRERQLANTKFELALTENARLTDNAYLIQQRDAAEARVTELERQLAGAQENYQTMLDATSANIRRGALAETKLRAVAALRDELLKQRDDTSHYTMEHRTAFEWMRVRLDAILGGDK